MYVPYIDATDNDFIAQQLLGRSFKYANNFSEKLYFIIHLLIL